MLAKQFLTALFAMLLSLALPALCSMSFAQVDFLGAVSDIPQAPPETAAAYYNPATGDVIFSNGEAVALLVLFFASSTDTPFDYSKLNINTELGEPAEEASSSLSFLDNAGLPAGIFNVGSILPTGANDANSFRELIASGETSGLFFQVPGTGGSSSPIQIIAGVPEPASSALGIFACCGAMLRRRRGLHRMKNR